MSVVACKMLDSGYEIAADSITVRGYTQEKGNRTQFSKLFEINGLVVGSVGWAEESALFQIFCRTHLISAPSEESVLNHMAEFSDWKSNKTGAHEIKNDYLLGIDGVIFSVCEWYITKVKTYESIGAGSDFALAALYLGQNVEKAVETAIELSTVCELPIQVIKKQK